MSPSRHAGIRATASSVRWLCPAKKSRSAPTGLQKARCLAAIAARIALPVIVLNWIGMPAFAQSTWVGTTSDWNTPFNWNPIGVPTGTAIFGTSTPTSITFSPSPTSPTISTLQFNAPGYILSPLSGLSITGSGIQAAPTNAPTFNVSFPQLEFGNTSTAGPANLNAFNTGPIDSTWANL
jgi:hypothetical protein